MSDSLIYKTKITTPAGTYEFEGSQEFVEKQVEKILSIAKSIPVAPPIAQPENPSTTNDNGSKKPARKTLIEQPQMLPNLVNTSEKITELREFYDAKKPETHIEIFAVLTYWLKNNCELPEVSISEMWTLYKILSIKAPKVLIQSFRDGKSKKAYFDAGKSMGKYYLTPFGETFVDHDLPHKASK